MPKACSHWSLICGQGSCVGDPLKYEWKAARGLIQWWEQICDSVDSGLSRSRRYPHFPGWLCQLLRAVLVGWDPQRVLFSHTQVEGAWEIPLNSPSLSQLPPPLSLFLISSGHLVGHIFGQTEFHSLRTLNLRPRVEPRRNKELASVCFSSSSLPSVGWVSSVMPASCFSKPALWSCTFSFVPPIDCLFYFCPCHVTCGTLLLWPGIEHLAPGSEKCRVLDH